MALKSIRIIGKTTIACKEDDQSKLWDKNNIKPNAVNIYRTE